MIKLKSNDGMIFEVEEYFVKMSSTLMGMFEALGHSFDRDDGNSDILESHPGKHVGKQECPEDSNDKTASSEGTEMEEEEAIILPNIGGRVLKKVIEWAGFHKDEPPPLEDEENKPKRTDNIIKFDLDLMNVDEKFLFDLIMGSHYLEVKEFYYLCLKTLANKIKGKSPVAVRKLLGITNDLDGNPFS